MKLKLYATKKKNISVGNTKSFYLEDDDHKEVSFNEKMLTFASKLVKI